MGVRQEYGVRSFGKICCAPRLQRPWDPNLLVGQSVEPHTFLLSSDGVSISRSIIMTLLKLLAGGHTYPISGSWQTTFYTMALLEFYKEELSRPEAVRVCAVMGAVGLAAHVWHWTSPLTRIAPGIDGLCSRV